MAELFIYIALFIGQMPFLAPTLDNAYPLLTQVIASGFNLHHVEVADQDPANHSLQAI